MEYNREYLVKMALVHPTQCLLFFNDNGVLLLLPILRVLIEALALCFFPWIWCFKPFLARCSNLTQFTTPLLLDFLLQTLIDITYRCHYFALSTTMINIWSSLQWDKTKSFMLTDQIRASTRQNIQGTFLNKVTIFNIKKKLKEKNLHNPNNTKEEERKENWNWRER